MEESKNESDQSEDILLQFKHVLVPQQSNDFAKPLQSNRPESERISNRWSSHKDYDYLFKIIMTGDSNSGKSHILQRFLTGEFTETKPTIGVEFQAKLISLVDGTRVNL